MRMKATSFISVVALLSGICQANAFPVAAASGYLNGSSSILVKPVVGIYDPRIRRLSWLFMFNKMHGLGLLSSEQVTFMNHCFRGGGIKRCMRNIGYCRLGPVPPEKLPVKSLAVYDNPFLILLKTGPDQLSGRVPKFAVLMTSWAPC
jgi:hypothetical protein